ncbi:hypothetical protein D6829_01130 [Candidatus Pacearchaeota archaeon]|nr:MAG: hypothetical protein D6829_01130 [Candidatus Pacearchaeota archaeon]
MAIESALENGEVVQHHPLKPVYQGLGEDYGLVCQLWSGPNQPLYITPDGNSMREISIRANVTFYDPPTSRLYFTQLPNALMATDGEKVKEIRRYEKGAAPWGIWREGDDVLVCLSGQGKIADHEGKVWHDNLIVPYEVRTLNGRLYHVEGFTRRCLVDTAKNERIATCGEWVEGLDISIDGKMLYFGSWRNHWSCWRSREVYAFDGQTQRIVGVLPTAEPPFIIASIHSVNEQGREVLYAGCQRSDTIHALELRDREYYRERVLLEGKVINVGSITAVPLEFLEKLDRNFGEGDWI